MVYGNVLHRSRRSLRRHVDLLWTSAPPESAKTPWPRPSCRAKQPEAEDKLAAIQKKNDDLLAAKISPAGHSALAQGLSMLAVAIAGMPTT
ncbi:hypothetical protein HDA40_002644 [Hamadaea flava]|uniref:Uncharacterized protein n=1 Tax=Hamadaea flava TaxID=1742688 RepID=A0ABV8LL30_9ACTN|nr:hypothetical protein [Hamadaea flava]MCP2324137.1 hypothetical protein [Hamadaea flava]